MWRVIVLTTLLAFVTLACGAGDEIPTLAPTAPPIEKQSHRQQQQIRL